MSIYEEKNCVLIKGIYYEKLENHPEGHQFRFTTDLNSEDYDYVEFFMLEDVLHKVFEQLQEITKE